MPCLQLQLGCGFSRQSLERAQARLLVTWYSPASWQEVQKLMTLSSQSDCTSWFIPWFIPSFILVGGDWNILSFPYIGNSHPNWPIDFHIFQRGGSITNQCCLLALQFLRPRIFSSESGHVWTIQNWDSSARCYGMIPIWRGFNGQQRRQEKSQCWTVNDTDWCESINDNLVGGDWNMNLIFRYIGNNHPDWLIFFKEVETTNQWYCLI